MATELTHSSVYTVLTRFNECRNFSSPWRFKDFGQLSQSLLHDIRRADVDFGYDDHDGDVESKSNSQMFSINLSERK